LCAGGLFATSALPAIAEDNAGQMTPSAKTLLGRGRYEQLTISYATVSAGATKPFSVLHISDTHFTAAYEREGADKLAVAERRTRTFGGFQEEAFRASLNWAKRNCDYVLHTGDLIDWQSDANFDLVRKYYGDAMFGSMGNHEFYTYMPDEKITSEEKFKDRSWKLLKSAYPIDARFSSKVVNGVNFVSMDDTFGTVQPDQVERFADEVKKGLPIVLCMHVPFITPEIWRATTRYWRQGKFTSAAIPAARPVSKEEKKWTKRKLPVRSTNTPVFLPAR